MPDTPSPGQDAQLDTLKMEYSEICKSYHNVRDMQLKLLTLIPIASGTAVSVVIKVPRDQVHSVMVGLVGFALTLGLFLYSLRGTRHADALTAQGSALEKEMHLDVGQFKDRPQEMTWIIGYTTASTLMYVVILTAWGYAIRLGL